MATYQKGSSGDTWNFQGVVRAPSATTQTLDSTYTLGQGMYERFSITDWTGIGSSFRAAFIRAQTGGTSTGKDLYGMELYGVAQNSMTGLKGLLSYAYIKGTTALTVTTAYGVHGELTFDAGASAHTITTEMSAGLLKITGGNVADFTKIHGLIVRSGDMDGSSRTYGNGILIEDDASMAGTITWTKGISITSPCTTGVSISGTVTNAVAISGTVTNAINFTGVTIGTATDGSLLKAGTSSVQLSAGTTADMKFVSIYVATNATTGTARGIYDRLFLNSGSGGEALRAYTTVGSNAPTDTCNGAHISMDFGASTGNITGLGTASRHTLHFPAGRNITGTVAAVQAELFADGASAGIGGTASFIRMIVGGHADLQTSTDSSGYLFDISGLTKGSGKLFQDNTAAAASQALRVLINGTPYYIMLTSTGA